MQSHLIRHPLLILAACFAAGILLARPGHALISGVTFLLLSACVGLLAGLVALRGRWDGIAMAFLLASFVAAGGAAAHLFERRFSPRHISNLAAWGADMDDPVRLEGRLISNPTRTSYGWQFDFEAERVESRGQVITTFGRVRLRMMTSGDEESPALADALKLTYGDSIRVLVRLRRPRVYGNPGSFDFRHWMESVEDISYVGTVKSPRLVEKLPSAGRLGASKLLQAIRRRFLVGIDRIYPPWSSEGRTGAVLKAVLFGDRSSLDSDTIENFRKTGLYHLLVIAGLHVGLLALLVGLVLRRLRLGETWRSAGVLLFLMFYALLVEQRAPTLRATIMITAYLLGRFLYRERSLLNAVGLAALALLVARPAWLFESGFQLSFSAALIIAALAVPVLQRTVEPGRRALAGLHEVDRDMTFSPRWAQFRLDLRAVVQALAARFKLLQHHPAVADWVVLVPLRLVLWALGILLFSALLQLGLLLPMAETFHRVTYAGIGLNALAIPVMTALLAAAVPTVLLAALAPSLAIWPGKLLAVIMHGLFALTDWPGLPAWLSYRVPEPPLWVSLGFVLGMIAVAATLGRARRAFWASLVVLVGLGAMISLHPFAPRLPKNGLEITALDCGGGDAIFVVFPNQTTMLVDACGSRTGSGSEGAFSGRRWDPGEEVVSSYLWSRGLTRIDVVALSHAHQDHLGGLGAVLRNFHTGEFWHGPNPPTPAYLAVLGEVRKLGIPERECAAGERLELGGGTVEILWPPAGRPTRDQPSNDDSVVLQVSADGGSALLTGDISESVEAELVRAGTIRPSQILKVAHHGARTSTSAEFLARVSPSVALITSESGGLVGLPSPEVLDRLRSVGARIFRTDVEGAISIELRESQLTARSYGGSAIH
ncbi:MAG: ComEC/Rec2 family competence protein [Terriglobia bacterium]